MITTNTPTPNPGSVEANALGCPCPQMDNGYGDPARREFDGWVIREGCPVHPMPPVQAAASDTACYFCGVTFAEDEAPDNYCFGCHEYVCTTCIEYGPEVCGPHPVEGHTYGIIEDDGPPLGRMSIADFRRLGYLQEANRHFFHPLGLALEVTIDEDGTERLSGIWDWRDDLEGIYYDEGMIDPEKTGYVWDGSVRRRRERVNRLGYYIQPVPVPAHVPSEGTCADPLQQL